MTTPDITIPPEAIEAAAKAIGEETYVGNKQTLKDAATAACRAMLAAWPGMVKSKHYAGQGQPGFPCISLPLPQEPHE